MSHIMDQLSLYLVVISLSKLGTKAVYLLWISLTPLILMRLHFSTEDQCSRIHFYRGVFGQPIFIKVLFMELRWLEGSMSWSYFPVNTYQLMK